MEAKKFNGTTELTDNATDEDLRRALADKGNQIVALHREGSEVLARKREGELRKRYIVTARGQWEKKKRTPADGSQKSSTEQVRGTAP
ncbi:hypothetical protein LCGC14_2072220 [marine sediment metagenome]|uniref:Uncharacterized protein n=1 Tax=marine sediment metagenome TaxID=412755 RepID=A0A0F9HF27_9ZZZZ